MLLAKIAIALAIYLLVMNILMRQKRKKTRNMIMTFGRGGHTAEMIFMSQKFDFPKRFDKVFIVVADDDQLSIEKAQNFWEKNKVAELSVFSF